MQIESIESTCIEATVGSLTVKGYRTVDLYIAGWNRKRYTIRQHVMAYEVAYGPVPLGLQVNHHCDNRQCVNPEHLYAGTQLDNIRDRDARGRNANGSHNGRAKLTQDQVLSIRADDRSKKALARIYGVSYSTVLSIKNRNTWTHV